MADTYVSIEEVRDEGVTVAMASDNRLTRLIALAENYIDGETLLSFKRRDGLTVALDGSGTSRLDLPTPALAITTVTMDSLAIAASAYVNYNDADGDDYWDPRLVMVDGPLSRLDRAYYTVISPWMTVRGRQIWSRGQKNVVLVGDFGFVDEDDEAPAEIKEATIRLVTQHLKPIGTLTDADRRAAMISGETLGNYSYTLNARRSGTVSAFASDPVVDEILSRYSRVAAMGAV